MPALLRSERDFGEQATDLRRIVVLDCRFEPFSRRQRLCELAP